MTRLKKVAVCVIAGALMWAPANAFADNIFKTLKDKVTNVLPSKSSNKSKKKSKTVNADVDIADLSLDENLSTPPVGEKQHAQVAAHMERLAGRLAERGRERVELMRDNEVVVATMPTDELFAANDTVLRSHADDWLKPYAQLLRSPGMYKMLVVAHTDDTGSSLYTDRLSEARANAVYDRLADGQMSSIELVSYGLGSQDPLNPNNSRENRARNRRIEIFIVPASLAIEMAKSQKLE